MIRMISISTTTTRRYLVEVQQHIGEEDICTNGLGEMTSTTTTRVIAAQRDPDVKITTAIFPAVFDEVERPHWKQ